MKVFGVLLSFVFILHWANGEHLSVVGKSRFFNNKALRRLASYMDVKADPCKDFYQYACGKWAEEHVDTPYTSSECMMSYEATRDLVGSVDTLNFRNKTGFVMNVMRYVKSCHAVKEDYDISNFINWLKKHEKLQWIDEDNEYNWAKVLGLMLRYGMNNVLLTEGIENSKDDITKMNIVLDKPAAEDLSLSEDQLNMLKTNLPDDYISENQWEELNEFAKKLGELYALPTKVGPIITLKKVPLGWMKKYMAVIFNKNTLDLNFELRVNNVDYFKALGDFLNGYEDELIYKYLQVRFLVHLQTTLYDDLDSFSCMSQAHSLLPLATSYIYEEHHPEVVDEYPKVISVFENIMAQIRKTLKSDKQNILPASVLETLDKIQLKIGILPRVDTINVVEDLYSDLSTGDDFYENHLKIYAFHFNKSHSVNTAVLTSDASQYFDISPTHNLCDIATPFNDRNLVVIPVPFLRQPLFHWAYSDFSTYSTLGVRIAKTILSALNFGVSSDEYKFQEIAALHIALDTFFANSPEGYNKDNELFNTMQRVFVLKGAQYFCHDDSDEVMPMKLKTFMQQSSRFSEIFECKSNQIINILSK